MPAWCPPHDLRKTKAGIQDGRTNVEAEKNSHLEIVVPASLTVHLCPLLVFPLLVLCVHVCP